MMRKSATNSASLIPTESVERVESHSPSLHSKKQRVSDNGLQIGDAGNQMAFAVHNGGGEPIQDHRKRKFRGPRKSIGKFHDGPNPPPGIPNGFKDVIEKLGGTLIIQKGLRKNDVSRKHRRFSMPLTQWIAYQDLSSELLLTIENENKSKRYVSVRLIDTKLRVWDFVSLGMWHLTKDWKVVITGGWNDIVAANDLNFNDIVQIWCFKFIETGRFGLAMVKIESGNDCNDIVGSDSQFAQSSNVAAPSIQPQVQASGLAGSSTHSDSNWYPSIAYSDFLNIESNGAMTDSNGYNNHQEHVVTDEVAGCKSSRVISLNNVRDIS